MNSSASLMLAVPNTSHCILTSERFESCLVSAYDHSTFFSVSAPPFPATNLPHWHTYGRWPPVTWLLGRINLQRFRRGTSKGEGMEGDGGKRIWGEPGSYPGQDTVKLAFSWVFTNLFCKARQKEMTEKTEEKSNEIN
jgi:hypothetical protein